MNMDIVNPVILHQHFFHMCGDIMRFPDIQG
ncbi:Uncharacterised protein [Mycobacteroides abscessus subsp. abscessus]|nr:Uncharacterised protein [Mycobacteroides abscessus subsp. abscessus]